jgi:hypothetical protein
MTASSFWTHKTSIRMSKLTSTSISSEPRRRSCRRYLVPTPPGDAPRVARHADAGSLATSPRRFATLTRARSRPRLRWRALAVAAAAAARAPARPRPGTASSTAFAPLGPACVWRGLRAGRWARGGGAPRCALPCRPRGRSLGPRGAVVVALTRQADARKPGHARLVPRGDSRAYRSPYAATRGSGCPAASPGRPGGPASAARQTDTPLPCTQRGPSVLPLADCALPVCPGLCAFGSRVRATPPAPRNVVPATRLGAAVVAAAAAAGTPLGGSLRSACGAEALRWPGPRRRRRASLRSAGSRAARSLALALPAPVAWCPYLTRFSQAPILQAWDRLHPDSRASHEAGQAGCHP